jgi:hypothetical protein
MVAERMDRRSRGELIRLDRAVIHLERTAAWQRVQRLGEITEASAIVGRPDWAQQAGAELRSIASRQLRMLDENGGKAS